MLRAKDEGDGSVAWEHELERLARERGPALVGYAYLLTGELAAAEDLVQDALVRAFTRRRSSDVTWAEAYVRRTILHSYVDGYRRRRRSDDQRHLLRDETRMPDVHAQALDRATVAAALQHLSPRQRACVVLRFYEDLTVPQIAARLELSDGAVKRYLSDASTRLRPHLGDVAGADDVPVISREARR
ncbi:sigma-70 family RNA polymerase sigma factor [Cellulomonas soli]